MNFIRYEVSKLNLLRRTNLFYFYGLHLNGKCCGKPGFTTGRLDKRIHNYLEREHKYQTKDYSSLKLIFAIEFENKLVTEKAEEFILSGLTDFPLHKNQPSGVEQFDLEKSWSIMRDAIIDRKFLFGNVYFDNPDADVDFILNKPHIYPENDYIPRYKNSKHKNKNKKNHSNLHPFR